jgi:hypothetical protein
MLLIFNHTRKIFSYADNPTDLVFYIRRKNTGARWILGLWDTTTITDGDYVFDTSLVEKWNTGGFNGTGFAD